MNSPIGIIEGEKCNRNSCAGILYNKLDGECTCHLGYPPCGYCVESIGCCPECGWNEVDGFITREVLTEKKTFMIQFRAPGHPCDFDVYKVKESGSKFYSIFGGKMHGALIPKSMARRKFKKYSQ